MSVQTDLTARAVRFGALFAVLSACLLLLAGISRAGDERPFKAVVHGYAEEWPPTSNIVYVDVAGEGTHLGKFTEVLRHDIDFSTGAFTGHAILQAANGDTFETEFAGQLYPTADPTLVTFDVVHTIVSGTGRFRGATGRFRGVDGLFNMLTGEDEGAYEGTISY